MPISKNEVAAYANRLRNDIGGLPSGGGIDDLISGLPVLSDDGAREELAKVAWVVMRDAAAATAARNTAVEILAAID